MIFNKSIAVLTPFAILILASCGGNDGSAVPVQATQAMLPGTVPQQVCAAPDYAAPEGAAMEAFADDVPGAFSIVGASGGGPMVVIRPRNLQWLGLWTGTPTQLQVGRVRTGIGLGGYSRFSDTEGIWMKDKTSGPMALKGRSPFAVAFRRWTSARSGARRRERLPRGLRGCRPGPRLADARRAARSA